MPWPPEPPKWPKKSHLSGEASSPWTWWCACLSWACRSEKEQLAEWSKDKAVRGREGQTEEAEWRRRLREATRAVRARRPALSRRFAAALRSLERQRFLGSIRFAPQSRARSSCAGRTDTKFQGRCMPAELRTFWKSWMNYIDVIAACLA